MNTYLDQLIKTVEAEAAEERIHLKEQERSRRYPSKFAGSGLRRALQRLEVLRSLRNVERRASASH
jgi:Ni/Co efflux regulator RcnB